MPAPTPYSYIYSFTHLSIIFHLRFETPSSIETAMKDEKGKGLR